MEKFVIETENLSKTFYKSKNLIQLYSKPFGTCQSIVAVDGVSLRIRPGEILAVVGPNESGKTTLVKMLSCLILPTKGTARINGYGIVNDEMKVKSSIGVIPCDERSFYWRLTGRENLAFFAALHGLDRQESRNRIMALSKTLGIDELDNRFQEYSSGMKQKFAVARSLLNDPPVLLMDEPTRNLDPCAAEDIRYFIKKEISERDDKAALLVTHDLDEAVLLGRRIAIMHKGKIKACGTEEELKNNAGLLCGCSIKEVFKHYVAG